MDSFLRLYSGASRKWQESTLLKYGVLGEIKSYFKMHLQSLLRLQLGRRCCDSLALVCKHSKSNGS